MSLKFILHILEGQVDFPDRKEFKKRILAEIIATESVFANGKSKDFEILSEGNPNAEHRHHFEQTSWPPDIGPDKIDAGSKYFATYQHLLECACGAKMIVKERRPI